MGKGACSDVLTLGALGTGYRKKPNSWFLKKRNWMKEDR
jgi:hypothetical protein